MNFASYKFAETLCGLFPAKSHRVQNSSENLSGTISSVTTSYERLTLVSFALGKRKFTFRRCFDFANLLSITQANYSPSAEHQTRLASFMYREKILKAEKVLKV